jgi:hypothetical protein
MTHRAGHTVTRWRARWRPVGCTRIQEYIRRCEAGTQVGDEVGVRRLRMGRVGKSCFRGAWMIGMSCRRRGAVAGRLQLKASRRGQEWIDGRGVGRRKTQEIPLLADFAQPPSFGQGIPLMTSSGWEASRASGLALGDKAEGMKMEERQFSEAIQTVVCVFVGW